MAKILIIDDSNFMRKLLKRIIEDSGHIIVGEASDGTEVLQKYKKLKPDLIFMDITMKNMSGFEALKIIKTVDNKAKIIMCSAMGQQLMIKNCIYEGALDFIVKPFKKDKIIESINKALLTIN